MLNTKTKPFRFLHALPCLAATYFFLNTTIGVAAADRADGTEVLCTIDPEGSNATVYGTNSPVLYPQPTYISVSPQNSSQSGTYIAAGTCATHHSNGTEVIRKDEVRSTIDEEEGVFVSHAPLKNRACGAALLHKPHPPFVSH